MKKAILVRVGIDQSDKSGNWNAPVDPDTGAFAYVPILEDEGNGKKPIRHGYKVSYKQFKKPCKNLGKELHQKFLKKGKFAHLDPDFKYLTYGDESRKKKRLESFHLDKGDILAFYAGLRPPHAGSCDLIYALIGLYVLEKPGVTALDDIPQKDWRKNAHTRREYIKDDDIIFSGTKDGKSGRLKRYIPIGEYRPNGYYLKTAIQKKWGEPEEVCLQHGYLPKLSDPDRFYDWFKEQGIPLVPQNNLD